MRIAIPYEDGVVCQHFGKAPQFKIFDVQPQGIVESVVIDSEASGHEALAEFLATQSVQAVICGGIGQGALVSLAQSGIDVLPGVSGNPDEVIEALIAGTLQPEGNGGCGCGCGGHHHEEHAGGCGCGGHGHEEQERGWGGVDITQPLIRKIERNRRFVKDYELACLCQVLQVSERDLLADFYNATE